MPSPRRSRLLTPGAPVEALNPLVLRAGMAGTTAAVAEAAQDDPDAVLALHSDLTVLWRRLLGVDAPAG